MKDRKTEPQPNTNRRNILKSVGAVGIFSAAFAGEAAGSNQRSKGRAEASDFFDRKIDQHGRVVDAEIKWLGKPGQGPSPDWRIKYTFEDGSKFPTFYNLRRNVLKVKAASERFVIDRERYEQALKADMDKREAETESRLDDDLGAKAAEFIEGGN